MCDAMRANRGAAAVVLFFGLFVAAPFVDAQSLWLDAHGDGTYLIEPLSTVSSWTYGGSLGIEVRDLFVTGPLVRLDLGYGEWIPTDTWVSYMRMASAVASIGYRIPLGCGFGLTPFVGGGVGVVFSASAANTDAYLAGTYTERVDTLALGDAGLAFDVVFAESFSARIAAAYRLIGESGGVYSGVLASVGMGWKLPLGQKSEPEAASETAAGRPAPEKKWITPEEIDAAFTDLAALPNIQVVRDGATVRVTIEASFAANKSDLSDLLGGQLDVLGKAAGKLPVAKVVIRGYVSEDLDATTDYQISLARAEAVASYLTAHGYLLAAAKETAGMGRANPVTDNSTDEGRTRNRRVEIELTMAEGTVKTK